MYNNNYLEPTTFTGTALGLGRTFWSDVVDSLTDLSKSGTSSYNENFPPMDLILDKESGEMKIIFALAGFKKDEIEVDLEGDFLNVSGEEKKKEEEEESKIRVVKKGIKKRKFKCRYQLPPGKFDSSKAKASFSEGLLEITFPANEDAKPRKLSLD